jgi:hypothetical protein
MRVLSHILRKTAEILFLSSTKIDDIPKLFKSIATYLKQAPETDFNTTPRSVQFKGVPLILTDDAIESFKKHVTEDIYQAGIASWNELNIFSVIGKLINRLYMIFQTKIESTTYSKEGYSLIKDHNEIWDGVVNEMALTEKYKGKPLKETIRDVTDKLHKSADLIENKMLPLIKKIDEDYP